LLAGAFTALRTIALLRHLKMLRVQAAANRMGRPEDWRVFAVCMSRKGRLTMNDLMGWVAPAATMLAAMMTAANLGARVTGWGFVVFLVGAVAWSVVAITTGQSNLLWSNAFLAVVDLIGIWRWLGHRAKLDDGAKQATGASAESLAPTLFPVSMLEAAALQDIDGMVVAHSAGAMVECKTGTLAYVVAREGGLANFNGRYVAIPWSALSVRADLLCLDANAVGLAQLPSIDPQAWPTRVHDLVPPRSSVSATPETRDGSTNRVQSTR
jgi:hypothetical protein